MISKQWRMKNATSKFEMTFDRREYSTVVLQQQSNNDIHLV